MPLVQSTQVNVDLYLHVRVLISIILGLGVARLVAGVAGLIQHPTRHRVSLIHLGWVAWALMNVITFWWWEFRLSQIGHWSFALYFFIFVYASMYYFLSVLLFPDDMEEYKGYLDYFLSRRAWFFSFVALTLALDVVDSWIKGEEHLRSLGPEYFILIGGFTAGCVFAARTRNLIYQALFLLVGALSQASFFVWHFSSMS